METEWILTTEELELLKGRSADKRLGFALSLKYFQLHYHFPTSLEDFSAEAISSVAFLLETPEAGLNDYFLSERLLKSHRNDIRSHTGFRLPTNTDAVQAKNFVVSDYIAGEGGCISESLHSWYISKKIELPSKSHWQRVVVSANTAVNEFLFRGIHRRLGAETRTALLSLCTSPEGKRPTLPTINSFSSAFR